MLPRFLKKLFSQRKIALILVLAFLLSTLAVKPILAFSTQPPPGYHLSFENAVFYTDEMNLQSFVFETIKATVSSLVAFFYCFTCPPDQRGGLLSLVGGLIAGVYAHPPASGVNYLAYMGQKLNLISPVYAQDQGVGFAEMLPYLSVWTKFRDLSYGLFVLIFIFIGFAIMFRIKISPQAVVTIESALPKLIIALLLITFSYAIVGFMVDIMMVISNLIIFTFKSLPDLPSILVDRIPATNFTDARNLFQTIFLVGVPPILFFILIFILLGAGLGAIVGAVAGGALAGPVAGIGALLAFLLIVIVFLIALLRLLWTLLKAYAMVVLSLIFSPFIILVGALPGSNAISGWFRNILANLAVLPTVLAMVFLAGYLTVSAWYEWFEQAFGTFLEASDPTRVVSEVQDVIAVGGTDRFLGAIFVSIISIVILLLAPRAADIIQSFLSGQPFAYGQAIGQALGPITGTAGAAWGLGKSAVGGEIMYQAGTRFVSPRAAAAPGGMWAGLEQWMKRQKYIQ